MILLDIRNLTISIHSENGMINVIDRLNLRLKEGEFRGIVGESGSGKTLLVKAIFGLLNEEFFVSADRFLFNEIDLLKLSIRKRRKVLGEFISIINQDPKSALDPAQKVLTQLMRAIPNKICNEKWYKCKKWKKNRAIELLHKTGIKDHEDIFKCFPNQLTEGECQKVMIAIALAKKPKLLLADEPTNRLERFSQQQIYRLLTSLNQNQNTTILLIDNDIKIVSEWAHIIQVIYCGQTVEIAAAKEILQNAYHPYTQSMLTTIPNFNTRIPHKSLLNTLPGAVPSIENIPVGCRLGPRCPYAQKICMKKPSLSLIKNHFVACYFPQIQD